MLSRRQPIAVIRWDDLSDGQLVDVVRACIGLEPLPRPLPGQALRKRYEAGVSAYITAEALQRKADPGCARCGGRGLFDGWLLEQRCPCTGMPQIKPHPPMTKSPNPDFGRRRS